MILCKKYCGNDGTDGLRHTTLWNGNNFVDVQNKTNYNYLLELIWNDSFGNTHIYHSSNFQFWELKD
ncbi:MULTISPECIES: hypothetical protein [Helicobacter]|uniref:Uncharacterized protein n=1 Tax=Helicobacter fennelliae MRY12-0050 TaxID=1325130 RepID=T1DVB0_9HELI|nr:MULTISPECIES: hypothetical protein [Helicobacter]QOQ95489.1 hypothetical protein HW245_07510 [Helicobacter cinaedi]GAD18588.1 hypothetical protein HFN_2000 [Helicobacter fennelliae MRY12-0050]STP14478.1 Uncharacterised protein [Helicobacter fennelliae]